MPAKETPRNLVIAAILKSASRPKLLAIFRNGHKGLVNLTPQALANMAIELLPAKQSAALAESLNKLFCTGLNRNCKSGDKLYYVLATRDAGTESEEIPVYAKDTDEAAAEALRVVDENMVQLSFNENQRDSAYLCADDCVELADVPEFKGA